MARLTVADALAVRLAAADNVATLLTPATAGARVAVRHAGGAVDADGVRAATDLPRGHKIALEPIAAGQPVVKYGLAIGRATADIGSGDHVHVHNVRSGLSGLSAAVADRRRERPVPVAALRRAIGAIVVAAGASEAAAGHMADALVEAHLRGVESHGVRRLAPYVVRIEAGGVDGRATPVLERCDAVLRVDGRAGIGHHVATVAADALVGVARELGVGCALIRNSSHFGFAGCYATRLALAGMAAMVVSNGQVLVAPEGARRALFSNDPLAIAAPLGDGTCLELDMAASVTSRAKVVEAAERGEPIAAGIATDSDGRPTTDAAAAARGFLLPFGGERGFALLAALELLAGVLGGDVYADMVVSKESDPAAAEATGHFMLAIDLGHAGGDSAVRARIDDLVRRIRAVPVAAGREPLRHPGQRRWRLRAERLAAGTVPLTAAEGDALAALAGRFGVALGWSP